MLNWIREKLFKRSSSYPSDNHISLERSSNLQQSSEFDRNNMLSEISPRQINDKITLTIIFNGETWDINVEYHQEISNLLNLALNHFNNPIEALSNSSRFKMIEISSKRVLNPLSTISDEHLNHGDEIMLVQSITTGAKVPINLTKEDIEGPTKEAILKATAHLPIRNPVQIIPSLDCQENFQSAFRQVLYSLIEASARILSESPDAKVIFDEISARINAKTKKEIDKNAVKTLKDLGFTEAQAKYALRLKRNRAVEAMEWLLENSHRVKEEEDFPTTSTTGPVADNPLDMIHQLLADICAFQERHFEPDSEALERLTSMGFSEDNAIEALKITRNNIVPASEWLCGERDLIETKPGLDSDSPLYKALMNSPAIQLGLHNPKVLLALLSMFENTGTLNLWMNDVDTGPVLMRVFKTYTMEKQQKVVRKQMELMNRQTNL